MPSKNYTFRCWPLDSPTASFDQMRLGHQYRNRLVAIEHKRRAESLAVVESLCPDFVSSRQLLSEATERVEAAVKAMLAERSKARARCVPASKLLAKDVRDAKAARKTIAAKFRAIKKASYARGDVQVALSAHDASAKKSKKIANANSDAAWGTRAIIDQSASGFGSGAPPKFTPFLGEGAIAVQLQKGLAVEIATAGSDTRLAIGPLAADESYNKQDMLLRLRIGSDGRAPIWSRWRIRLHRDFPAGAVIKWAKIIREIVGTQVQWRAMLTIDVPDSAPAAIGGIVAVHLGWRLAADRSLRVACWRGDDGRSGELLLGAKHVESLSHLAAIQSHADRWRDVALGRIKRWCAAAKNRGVQIPAWLDEMLPHIHAWKSHDRICDLAFRLTYEWRGATLAPCGFDGDDRLARWLTWWRVRKSRHLRNWAAHLRRRINGHRDDDFRRLAKRLAAEYRHIALANINWAMLRKKSPKEVDSDVPAIVRRLGSFAAPGTLSRFAKESFGERVLLVAAAHITDTCHGCGALDSDWPRDKIEHRCAHCGRIWDQDHNAAANTLARGGMKLKDLASLAEAEGLTVEEFAMRAMTGKQSKRRERMEAGRKKAIEARRVKELAGN